MGTEVATGPREDFGRDWALFVERHDELRHDERVFRYLYARTVLLSVVPLLCLATAAFNLLWLLPGKPYEHADACVAMGAGNFVLLLTLSLVIGNAIACWGYARRLAGRPIFGDEE